MLQVADSVDFEFRLLRATIDTNTRQYQRNVDKIRVAVTGRRRGSLARRRLALFGLTFKAGTDDLRDSPALAVAALLRQAGAEWTAYDPRLRAIRGPAAPAISVAEDPYVAAKDADAIVILTEWPEFRTLDWARLAAVARQSHARGYRQPHRSGCGRVGGLRLDRARQAPIGPS